MLRVNHLTGFGAARHGGPVGTFYLTTLADTGNTSPYTFTDVPIGPADVNRTVFVEAFIFGSGNAFTSVTIQGIAAGDVQIAGPSGHKVGLFVADVPTGTTATIIVTASGTVSECMISVYKTTVPGMLLLDGASNTSGSATAITVTDLNMHASGIALAACFVNSTSPTVTVTNSGADAVVVDNNGVTESTKAFVARSIVTTEDVTTNDLTFTQSGAVNSMTAVAASFYAPGGSAYTPVKTDTFSSITDTNAYTFSAKAIGTANASRQLLICFGWASTVTRTVSSVTVDGNAATLVDHIESTASGVAIYRYPIAAGTTAEVIITMSGTVIRIAGDLYDTRTREYVDPISTGTPSSATATSVTVANVQVRKGGFLVVAGIMAATETTSAVYNGVDTLGKDDQVAVEALHSLSSFSCLTTEFATTNDPGFSSASSNLKRVVAASFF